MKWAEKRRKVGRRKHKIRIFTERYRVRRSKSEKKTKTERCLVSLCSKCIRNLTKSAEFPYSVGTVMFPKKEESRSET